MKKPDWKSLAHQLGASEENGDIVGMKHAQRAVELLLGEENIREAVDYYISGKPGAELSRFVLMLIRPWPAMLYCHELYSSSREVEIRRTSVELLRVIADERALAWVLEFLRDDDAAIQLWGASLLEQLVSKELIEVDQAESVIIQAEQHSNPHVQERAKLIREFTRSQESS